MRILLYSLPPLQCPEFWEIYHDNQLTTILCTLYANLLFLTPTSVPQITGKLTSYSTDDRPSCTFFMRILLYSLPPLQCPEFWEIYHDNQLTTILCTLYANLLFLTPTPVPQILGNLLSYSTDDDHVPSLCKSSFIPLPPLQCPEFREIYPHIQLTTITCTLYANPPLPRENITVDIERAAITQFTSQFVR